MFTDVGVNIRTESIMEKRLLRIEILVVILLILGLVNLFLSNIFELNKSNESDNISETTKELPSDLTKKSLNKIAYKIKTDFNKPDWIELYNVFGEYAKAQISINDVESEFIKLKSAIGNIQTYAFSHYVYSGNEENAEWFKIYYKCRFDNGKGTIRISTRTLDNVSEVTGLNITLDEF